MSCSSAEVQAGSSNLRGTWLPVVLTFIAFREMEFFLPRDYDSPTSSGSLGPHPTTRLGTAGRLESFGFLPSISFAICSSKWSGGVRCRLLLPALSTVWLCSCSARLAHMRCFPLPTRSAAQCISAWRRHCFDMGTAFQFISAEQGDDSCRCVPSAHVSAAFYPHGNVFWPSRPGEWGGRVLYSIRQRGIALYWALHYAATRCWFGVSVAAVCLYMPGTAFVKRGPLNRYHPRKDARRDHIGRLRLPAIPRVRSQDSKSDGRVSTVMKQPRGRAEVRPVTNRRLLLSRTCKGKKNGPGPTEIRHNAKSA